MYRCIGVSVPGHRVLILINRKLGKYIDIDFSFFIDFSIISIFQRFDTFIDFYIANFIDFLIDF